MKKNLLLLIAATMIAASGIVFADGTATIYNRTDCYCTNNFPLSGCAVKNAGGTTIYSVNANNQSQGNINVSTTGNAPIFADKSTGQPTVKIQDNNFDDLTIEGAKPSNTNTTYYIVSYAPTGDTIQGLATSTKNPC